MNEQRWSLGDISPIKVTPFKEPRPYFSCVPVEVLKGRRVMWVRFGGYYVFIDDVKNKCLLIRDFNVYLFTLLVHL